MYIWKTHELMTRPYAAILPVKEDEVIEVVNLNRDDFPEGTEYWAVYVEEKMTFIAITPQMNNRMSFKEEKSRILDMVIDRNVGEDDFRDKPTKTEGNK